MWVSFACLLWIMGHEVEELHFGIEEKGYCFNNTVLAKNLNKDWKALLLCMWKSLSVQFCTSEFGSICMVLSSHFLIKLVEE